VRLRLREEVLAAEVLEERVVASAAIGIVPLTRVGPGGKEQAVVDPRISTVPKTRSSPGPCSSTRCR
jgi:hypothetical protein